MKKLITLFLACGVFAGALLSASASPTMRLSADGGLTWTIVEDNGPLDSNPAAGILTYAGPVGTWLVVISQGFGSPDTGSPITPTMDASTTDISSGPATLIVQLSDTNYVPFPNETYIGSIAATVAGTLTYNVYRDGGNVLFGSTSAYAGDPAGISPSATAVQLFSEGPFVSGTAVASNAVTVPNGTGPYSLTLETLITHNGAGTTLSDAFLTTVPPPPCTGQIGDFIWNDVNGNGCQDAGEPGIPGVTVNLYTGCGANKSASPIKSTTTDSNGNYLFDGLCAGDYTVNFITPNGFVHTVAHQGCGGTPGDVHNPNDSNCECTGADNCDVCVNLPTGDTQDLTIDCGYIGAQPCLTFFKTADTNSALAGSVMGYTYAITNCGGTTFTNLAIIDDAGTPGFTADDFSVISGLNLAPGQGTNFHVFVNLPIVTCVSNSSPSTNAGLLIVTKLANGNIKVTYRQSRGLNDNVYGTPAPADGWSQHKFSDLTGSDQCRFQFTDGTGKVVLDFYSDYISQTTSNALHPSGYASLGPNGGDGKMVTGTSNNVVFYTSTLADNLNSGLNGGFPSPYTVNSPSPEANFPNWDYVDGYTVIVSSNAFGAAGFGGVTVPTQHNSPAKVGANQVNPVPCGGCITNIATVVVADANGVILTTVASDDAVVCTGTPTPPPPTCIITAGAMKIGPNNITIPLKNAGTAAIVLSEVDLTWKQTVNGKINKMSLNGDFFTPAPGAGATSPAAISSGFVADPNKRTIAPNKTLNLTIQFEHPADKTVGDYTGGVIKFGTCTVNFP